MVFVSYSRKDAEWRDRFEVMLAPLVRERALEVWSDQREVVGEEWDVQLDEAISRSQAALLLVSPDFLASDFIMEQELPALIGCGVTLVCVLVRPSLWRKVPKLAGLHWAHDPARALSQQENRDGAIVRVCEKLIELPALQTCTASREQGVRDGHALGREEPVDAVQTTGEREGALVGVPPLPNEFVAREELADVRRALLATGRGAVGVTGRGLGLHGQGGIGKTVLAVALAHDSEVRAHFPDGVFWVTLGEGADTVAAQRELLDRLGAASEVRSAIDGKAALERALADRQALVVVDDVWSGAAAIAFRVTGPRGRVLYTTRDHTVLSTAGAEVMRVEVLPEHAARQLLAKLTGDTIVTLPAEAAMVIAATERVALALALIGAAIGRGGASWPTIVEQLKLGESTFLSHPYANVFKTMQIAVAALKDSDTEAYLSLAVYPQDTKIPVEAVARYWSRLWDCTSAQTRALLKTFAERELLVLDGETITFHDLQRDFLLLQADSLALLHGELIAAYRTLLPTKGSSLSELPPEAPYIWEHFVYHLQRAGDGSGIIALVCDLAYLAQRCFRSGPYAIELDLLQTASLYPDDAAISWLLHLFTQWGYLFAGQSTIEDLAVTLASRTNVAPASLNTDRLGALLPAVYLAPLWGLPGASAEVTRVLKAHTNVVRKMAFSPGASHWLASGSHDQTVRLWDFDSGQLMATFKGHTGALSALAFSPNGDVLASAAGDGGVRLWDPDTGQLTATLQGHTSVVNVVAFSPDGHVLASASDDRTVRLWDPASGQPTATLQGHTSVVNAIAFSPNGHVLASAGADGTVRLWDPATDQPTATLQGHTNLVNAVAFSPDGHVLASASGDQTVRLWDPATGQPTATLQGHTNIVNAVAFSPDGHVLASASGDGTVRLWDPVVGQPAATVKHHTGWVSAVAGSPDGRLLASGGADQTVRLWDPATGQPTVTLRDHTDVVRGVAFSPNGQWLASAGQDRTIRLWDPNSRQLRRILKRHHGWVNAVAFSPDGRWLATASEAKTVRLWDAAPDPASAKPTVTLEGHTRAVNALAFSPDGRWLASASDDRTVRLWALHGRDPDATLRGHTGAVGAVAFSPDGRWLASASDDRTVRLWALHGDEPTVILRGHTSIVSAVAFSPDGRLLASAGFDEAVRLWNREQHEPVSQLKLGAPIRGLTWDRSGITLAAYASVVHLAVIGYDTANGIK